MLDFAVTTNRQIEAWLATLLAHEDVGETARVEEGLQVSLKSLAGYFGCERCPHRRRRLAMDIAAILRLHTFMQREAVAGVTVAATAKKVEAWALAVEHLERTVNVFERTGRDSLAGAMSSLAALEIVLDAVLTQAVRTDGIKGRMLRSAITSPVDAVLEDVRYRLLIGAPGNALPLNKIEDAIADPPERISTPKTCPVDGPDDDIDDIISDIQQPQVDRYTRDLALARRTISLTRRHGEAEKAMVSGRGPLRHHPRQPRDRLAVGP